MKTKLTFLLALTFLLLFSGSVYGEELEVKKTYWDNRKFQLQEWETRETGNPLVLVW
jgi:hypothetical protein